MIYLLANSGDVNNFCTETSAIWQFVGYVLFVFKIAIPLLIILFGMIDLGKAVVANDDKAIKSATSSLVKRAIAGVVIFFLPVLVSFIFSIVNGFSEVKNTYDNCRACVVHPNGDTCKNAVAQYGNEAESVGTKNKDDEN